MDVQNIAITLPNDTVYVEGTINGVNHTFTLSGTTPHGTVWTADVARAIPDVYVCRITATASTGSSTTIETTLYYGILNLITDRTRADVERAIDLSVKGLLDMTADELAEFYAGMKGAYNATDLNRVESAVQYIANRLPIAGKSLNLDVKTLWEIKDVPIRSEMERYLGNVRKLREIFVVPDGTPDVPIDMNRLTYEEANNIEKILLVVDEIITNISLAWFYCSEVYAGEV